MKNPPLHRYATRPGRYFTDDGGADVVVRSETADQVWLCVLEPIDEPSAFFQDAIRLFEERKVYVEGFISARFPIEQIQEGMDQAVTGKAHNMKTIFDY